MPAITTTRVCASLPDLDHEWAIVAETVPACVIGNTAYPAGWAWVIAEVAEFIMAREQGRVVTVQGRGAADGEFVLYAKIAQPRVATQRIRRAA